MHECLHLSKLISCIPPEKCSCLLADAGARRQPHSLPPLARGVQPVAAPVPALPRSHPQGASRRTIYNNNNDDNDNNDNDNNNNSKSNVSRPFLEATLKAPRGGQFIIIIMMIMIIMIMIIIITVKVMCPGPSSKPPSRRLEEDNL